VVPIIMTNDHMHKNILWPIFQFGNVFNGNSHYHMDSMYFKIFHNKIFNVE